MKLALNRAIILTMIDKPTIDSKPGALCFILKLSSGKATSPYILQTPVPSPCRGMTIKNILEMFWCRMG